MSIDLSEAGFLNGTALKIIAIISMTIDHIGFIFFPQLMVLRYLGRLAFPIFAYMIAEGCYYTKNKRRYIALVFVIGLVCQAVMVMAQREYRMNIMFTLFLAIALIFTLQWARGSKDIIGINTKASDVRGVEAGKQINVVRWILFAVLLLACVFITKGIPVIFPRFHIDYGIFGVLLPVVIYIPREKYQKLLVAAIWMIFLCIDSNPFQWYCLFALIPLAFYNGKPGRHRMKYFFYLYYPLHLAILWGIKLF